MKFKPVTMLGLAIVFSMAGFASAAETRLVRFGLITDTHVSDKTDQSPVITTNATARYFSGGLAKIDDFANAMNKANAAFVAELGDYTDNPANGALPYAQRKEIVTGFVKAAEARLAKFNGPRYHVFGNHDTDQMSKEDYLSHLTNTGIQPGATYYSFNHGGVHFVVFDASFKSDTRSYSGVPGTQGAGYHWSDANVPAEEINWLKADLNDNSMPVIVLTHQFLNTAEQVDSLFDPAHTVKNAAEIRSILEKSGKVLAVFSGHYHDGSYQQINGIAYIGLQANAAYGNDANYHNQYATIDVRIDGKQYQLAVAGNGGQKSYVINRTLP